MKTYRVGMGASSLLMILVVLSLTTLGVLALTGALADARLSERAQKSATDYYDAAASAQETLAALDAALLREKTASADAADYAARVNALTLDGVTNNKGVFAFSADAADDRALRVTAEALPFDSAARYRVTEHVLTDEREWNARETYDGLFG